MKTVLEITGKMNRGGAETMLVDIIKQTSREFHYAFLINVKPGDSQEGEYDETLRELGCSFYYINTVWSMGIPAYTRKFMEICRQITEDLGPIEVAHCHMNSKCGTSLRAAEKAGIPKRIAHSHAEIKFNGNPVSRFANNAELFFQKKLINRYATDYWGCSEKALYSLYSKKHIRRGDCEIIRNAIDVDRFVNSAEADVKKTRDRLKIPQHQFVLGTVGRLARVKNTKFLIEVLARVQKTEPDAVLVIVGGAQDEEYAKEIHAEVQQKKLEDSVIFTGVQPHLENIYPLFDLYLGSSLREGLGLVAVEAQACGVPCLISGGFPEEVDIGLNLVRFEESYEPERWAEKICSMRHSSKKRPDAETLRRHLTDHHYDASREAQRVRELYDSNQK